MTYQEALQLTIKVHDGQLRKSKEVPFHVHPIRVSEAVQEYFKTHKNIDVMRKAALLHDTIEDTELTLNKLKNKFGEEVARIVYELTIIKGEDYKEKLKNASEEAKIIKLLDIRDNVFDSFEGERWNKFLKKCEGTLNILELNNIVFNKLKEDTLNIIRESYV